MRLRMIESEIEHAVYRARKKAPADPNLVQDFLAKLTVWQSAIPGEFSETPKEGRCNIKMDEFMVPYYKCVRLLLYSQLSQHEPNLQYLKSCAEACAGLCGSYKRLNRVGRVDGSPLALQSLFICGALDFPAQLSRLLTSSGVTLLYCVWLAPPGYLNMIGAISDCNMMLYIMAERSPTAHRYLDIFERVKMNVLDIVQSGSIDERRYSGVLDAEITDRCRSLERGMMDTVRTDYEQIISGLAKKTNNLELEDTSTPDLAEFYKHDMDLPPAVSATGFAVDISSSWKDFDFGDTYGTFTEPIFHFGSEKVYSF
ncbi:hypothetical protein P154DRAFT_595348 [Amniculicola lignicola CBS 123094]|uniref:Transcription factor domain-containing protein n=1 Tax=Amniculicola lignicola CBS 123094 TaxID=1392246 RepID=A0A6A5WRV7_9PLEO|nr:hypothetical protein P154DRAFT_595348 [Amniculicola lignicola CBS 123094]